MWSRRRAPVIRFAARIVCPVRLLTSARAIDSLDFVSVVSFSRQCGLSDDIWLTWLSDCSIFFRISVLGGCRGHVGGTRFHVGTNGADHRRYLWPDE